MTNKQVFIIGICIIIGFSIKPLLELSSNEDELTDTISTSDNKSNPNAKVEMELMFDMGWEEVIEVKNCGNNQDMALEVIEGLILVSQKNGAIPRTYRVK